MISSENTLIFIKSSEKFIKLNFFTVSDNERKLRIESVEISDYNDFVWIDLFEFKYLVNRITSETRTDQSQHITFHSYDRTVRLNKYSREYYLWNYYKDFDICVKGYNQDWNIAYENYNEILTLIERNEA